MVCEIVFKIWVGSSQGRDGSVVHRTIIRSHIGQQSLPPKNFMLIIRRICGPRNGYAVYIIYRKMNLKIKLLQTRSTMILQPTELMHAHIIDRRIKIICNLYILHDALYNPEIHFAGSLNFLQPSKHISLHWHHKTVNPWRTFMGPHTY